MYRLSDAYGVEVPTPSMQPTAECRPVRKLVGLAGGVNPVQATNWHVNDHLNGAIPGSVYWSHPGIGLMEPPRDRPIGAT